MKLVFDMSSFIWTGLLAGKDPEALHSEHNGKPVTINRAPYGYENVINMMCRAVKEAKVQPIDCILVFEGLNSKGRRLMIDKEYKQGREHPAEAYGEFQALRDRLYEQWRGIGAMCLTQSFAEGDDVLGWLAENSTEDLIIGSYDNDIAVLNTEPRQTTAKGITVQVWKDGMLGINKYAIECGTYFPYKLITTYKALVGDSTDNIKGCPGFGGGAFKDFLAEYGVDGLQELHDMLLAGELSPDLHAMAAEETNIGKRVVKMKVTHPLIRKICDNEEQVLRCFQLALLHPEWVDTDANRLSMQAGIVLECPEGEYDARLKQWYGTKTLITAENIGAEMENMLLRAKGSPFLAFDIEASSADESDAWLAAQDDPDGVDQLGSTLTGFSFTFGPNTQHTVYVSVDHRDTANVKMSQARKLIEMMVGEGPVTWTVNKVPVVIHNNHYELPVLFEAQDEDGTLWRDHWKNNGYKGFLPRSLDTKLEASYVDENQKLGLKLRSKLVLGYEQEEYAVVTTLESKADADESGAPTPCPTLPAGGRHKGYKAVELVPPVWADRPIEGALNGETEQYIATPAVVEIRELRQYKMNELPATHVFDYGCDDTICTAAQHVFYKFIMEMEGTYQIYQDVEIDASYQHAKNFVDGIAFSLEKSKELERADDVVYDAAWAKLRAYLIEKGWDGTVPPTYTEKISLKEIKEAFKIVTGDELDTMVRTPSKIIALLRAEDEQVFSGMLEECISGPAGAVEFTAWVRSHFKEEPIFNLASPIQMQNLLYEVMGLEVEVRNKPTDIMRAKGLPGAPKTDELAIKYAMRKAPEHIKALLEAIRLMKMVTTRRSLYYYAYPNFVHWKTGRIHPSHNQCATNTRRASEMKPNKTQLPKHQKIEALLIADVENMTAEEEANMAAIIPRYREAIVPHKHNAVVVSMDFKAQELRCIAVQSLDPNLLACYVGDDLKDVHSLTGVGIAQRKQPDYGWTYEQFEEVRAKADLDKTFAKTPIAKFVKDCRNYGKKVNFTAEYGAMAPKVAQTLIIEEDEAQDFLDAREAMFIVAEEWKEDTREEARRRGFVTTMLGARRHLRDALTSTDRFEASKAERQAVNFKVQGSCGEQTKLAEGRMWKDRLFFDFDAVCYGPIHDEVCASVVVDKNFPAFIKRMHAAMVADYASMSSVLPIESSISFGPNFGIQLEIGDAPTDEAIAEGLRRLAELSATV